MLSYNFDVLCGGNRNSYVKGLYMLILEELLVVLMNNGVFKVDARTTIISSEGVGFDSRQIWRCRLFVLLRPYIYFVNTLLL